ncbi:MAG: 2-oxo acid dehydrogenase subunit E2 [Persicimonas sp.]
MVSSIAQFVVEQAFAPLVPASRCPLVVIPGKIREAPVVKDGELAVGKMLTVSCTADHRCYDGAQGGRFVREMKEMLANPREHFPSPQTWAED